MVGNVRWGGDTLGGRLLSNARVVIFDFLVSFSIVTIETPHISTLRYSVAAIRGVK